MTLVLLGFLALAASPTPAATPAPTAFSYRTSDGVEHFVGSEDDVPEAYRKVEKRIKLDGVPLNNDLAKGWHQSAQEPPPEAKGKATDIEATSRGDQGGPSPTVYAILAAVLLCLFPGLLLGWLRAPRQRIAILALAIVDLSLGLGLGLYATRQLRPQTATDFVDLDPLHAIDNARHVRDQVNAAQAAQEKQFQQALGEKPPPPPKPKATAAPAPTVPPQAVADPSAPGTPVRKVIKPSGAADPEDPE